jgi:indolepyruvate ferredoxin oxidoreductase
MVDRGLGEYGTDSKYRQQTGVVFLTGVEAIIRLLLEKQLRDQSDDGGEINQTFISGYEGSPLGGLDLKVVENLALLNERGRTVHQFGINEKTAASAMLGSQYAPTGDVDAFWYGKAHGTMWIPDEVWLANLAGTSRRGSMVLLCGEDHRSKSSVSPGTSDWVLRSSMVPVFYPASVSEILKLGMHAIQLSRYLGVVTALKLVTPLCDGASTVRLETSDTRPQILLPDPDFRKQFNRIVMALGALPMQKALVEDKLPLVEEYVCLNQLNTVHDADAGGDVGIIATGKSCTDVRSALGALDQPVPVLQLSVTYPLDRQTIRQFARGKRRIYVVEEPGPFVEDGVKAALWGSEVESVNGQYDEAGRPLIPSHGEIDPEDLAQRLWPRLNSRPEQDNPFLSGLTRIMSRVYPQIPAVSPMSCGGCPYNVFRDLDEKPGGAIGCSSIRAMDAYDNQVLYIPTMGAGGSIYSGTAAFNGNQHIFQYLGDGSYFHSGRGAVQSCVQADVNITFLLLFNGAVALTGGQEPGGKRSVPDVARELLALGVCSVGIVSEDSRRYRRLKADGVRLYSLGQHAAALQQFSDTAGTTALILDKECATEKTRRRRRERTQPDRYVMINEDICEGCGDCYRQSEGCAALYKVPTDFGEKTQVRQSSCVQDELCVDGECPSFVTVRPAAGVGLRRMRPESVEEAALPEPTKPSANPYVIYAVGRGGTGVVTISHLIAYAAMMDNKQVYLSNNTGLAQKGGPVEAPIVIGDSEPPVFNRLLPGSADLLLGFDLLRAAEPGNLYYTSAERTTALVSTTRLPTAEMNRNPDREFPDPDKLADLIEQFTVPAANVYLDTYWMSEQLFGDVLYANMLLLGAAYQAGRLPVSAPSLEEAVRLNGKQVEENLQAFRWGRLAVADPQRVEALIGRGGAADRGDVIARNRGDLIHRNGHAGVRLHDEALAEFSLLDAEVQQQFSTRIAELAAYQNVAYAKRYVDTVRAVWHAEGPSSDVSQSSDATTANGLTRTVILQLFQLMAYKDEYEVARLATRATGAEQKLREQFDGPVRIAYNLNPPTIRRLGLGKIKVGPWLRPALRLLARLKVLRESSLNPFGFSACRRLERELIPWYEGCLRRLLKVLTADNHGQMNQLLQAVDAIRGYEQIKIDAAEKAVAQVEEGLRKLEG